MTAYTNNHYPWHIDNPEPLSPLTPVTWTGSIPVIGSLGERDSDNSVAYDQVSVYVRERSYFMDIVAE